MELVSELYAGARGYLAPEAAAGALAKLLLELAAAVTAFFGGPGSPPTAAVTGNLEQMTQLNPAALTSGLGSLAPEVTVGALFKVLLELVMLVTAFLTSSWPAQSTVADGDRFDFIIVGGGTAGCVLANRLTEVSGWKVLLVEAGGDPPIISVIPGAWQVFTHTSYDWDFYSEDDKFSSQGLNSKKVAHTRGKMLGGSSSLHHLIYERGSRMDYEQWVNDGAEGWDWETVLKYFKKSEKMLDESIMNGDTAEYHGDKGPLSVKNQTVTNIFLAKNDVMLKAYEEIGFTTIKDSLTGNISGNSRVFVNIGNNPSRRASTAEAYLVPIRDRNNFYLLKNTLATKIIFNDDLEAIGVSVRTPNGEINVYAKNEVILSAGTFNSPKLLMLSGIGPQEDLNNLGIEVKMDLPVGKKFQDHITAPIAISGANNIATALDTLLSLGSLTSFPAPIIGGNFALGQKQPNIQQASLTWFLMQATREKMFVLTCLTKPESRGSVTLKSTDPTVPPIIKTGYFSNAADLTTLSAAVQRLVQVSNASYFSEAGGSFIRPPLTDCDSLTYQSEEYWQCYVRVLGTTVFHPSGTCAIGQVVDSRLKVKGVSKLRVVDDSVFPSIPAAKTCGTTIMVAEKAADLIKGDHMKTQGYEDGYHHHHSSLFS